MSDILVDVKTVEQVQIEKLSAAIEELNLNIRENEALSERICNSYIMLKTFNQKLTAEVMQLINEIQSLDESATESLQSVGAITDLLSERVGNEKVTH